MAKQVVPLDGTDIEEWVEFWSTEEIPRAAVGVVSHIMYETLLLDPMSLLVLEQPRKSQVSRPMAVLCETLKDVYHYLDKSWNCKHIIRWFTIETRKAVLNT